MRRLAALVVLLAAGCRPAPASLESRIDAAAQRASAWLAAQQAQDGAWRSETYAALGDGWSLTATATKALAFTPGGDQCERAVDRGLARLAAAVGADGSIALGPEQLPYPVYTAALAVIVFSRADPGQPARWTRERDAWLGLLESHQLTEALGWSADDPGYGGWGYALVPPRKGAGGFEADLSSTLFALGALRVAGREAHDPLVERARVFVERCQNVPLPGEGGEADVPFDGGFFMTPCTDFQNKAGGSVPRREGAPRARSRSSGSMTADGLRALLRCGSAREDERVQLALAWIGEHFDAAIHPGDFEPLREVERDAARFYWSWSVAHGLAELGVTELDGPTGPRRWARELAEELLAEQRPDGSWSNHATLVKEDDPLVATPLALAALSLCRVSLASAGESGPQRR